MPRKGDDIKPLSGDRGFGVRSLMLQSSHIENTATMKAIFQRLALLSFFIVAVATLSPVVALAQAAEGLQIRPAVVEDSVNPGDTYRFTLKVTNVSGEERTYYLGTQDIKGTDSEGKPVFADLGESTGFELSSWIATPQETITIKAGETRDVPFVAHVPKTASPGAHFGALFFDVKPRNVSESGSAIGIRVGSILNLRIAGDIVEDASLREFSTEKLIYGVPSVVFTTKVENHGNVLARPRGFIEVTDMFGKKVATIPVNDSASAVFPGSIKVYATPWEHDGFAFGRYQALVSLVYGDEVRRTISSATSFWILPLKPILLVLGSLVGFVVVLYLIIRSYIQRKMREMGISSSQRVAADLYTQKYSRSSSRLFFLVLGVSIFVLVFLVGLFMMFA